jgi:hypothetical protein
VSIISAILAFLKLAGTILGLVQEARQQQTGIDLQSGADAKAALAVETRVAEVAAQTVGVVEVDKALSVGGEF